MNIRLINKDEDQTYTLLEHYRDLDRQIKFLTKQKDELAKSLKGGYFLDHTEYVHDGKILATYKNEIVIRLNQKLLKEKEPIVFDRYCEASQQRRFLLK